MQFGNSPETVMAFWGVLKAGGVTVVMHPELKSEKTELIFVTIISLTIQLNYIIVFLFILEKMKIY